ncbi:DUF7289 family protein [Natronorubrum tibetense]|uniref:Uncharacterized protein n=1 Tax=Natronorubrum tibetense GA33 TaxID=1114856 RepID=L9VYQ8_9EURY|nr:hypothetical protein [Natronorubrum tibetense]ELY42157.1 hypothetical protein C496_07158 [Natronorubrum tibetense GA33]
MIDRRDGSSPNTRFDDRGVSEVVAFVLVFGMILVSVGLLYTVGFQAMHDYQENEQLKNAERAMDALSDNFNDVLRYSGVDQRYGEISMREGTVTTSGDGTTLNITIDDDPVVDQLDEYNPDNDLINLGEFRYHDGGESVAYEGGGLVRADETGSAVLKQPRITCNGNEEDDGTAIISLVSITGGDHSIRSSEGLGVTMSVDERYSTVIDVDDGDAISIEANSADGQYDTAWESALKSNGWEWDDDEDEGTCDGIDRLVVTIVETEIAF